jgi:hypothetical protein
LEDRTEKAFSPKEMNITLNIGDSTLRKWCIAMEKHGYKFIRNDQNTRIFVESDLVVLRHFQNLVKHHNMQLDNAAKLVVDRFGKGSFEVSTGVVLAEKEEEQRGLTRSNEEIMTTLLEHIKTQDEFKQELLHRLDQQQKYIDERFARIEREQELTESLRESLKQIAVAQEEKKKGFFARLFGK